MTIPQAELPGLPPDPEALQRQRRTCRGFQFTSAIADRRFSNPKGIASASPGLRGTSYPGLIRATFSTPTGLCQIWFGLPQPRWGCSTLSPCPKVARSSQPCALSRNPYGIHLWDVRHALVLILALLCLAAISCPAAEKDSPIRFAGRAAELIVSEV